MTQRMFLLASLVGGAALLQACATPEPPPIACGALGVRSGPPADLDYLPLQPEDGADTLPWARTARLATHRLACGIPNAYRRDSPILVATAVDLHTMKSDVQFGRVMTELVANRLARLGFPVVEVRLRDSLVVQENAGELMLSRQAQELAKSHKTPLAVVGTFSESLHQTIVNLRAVRASDGMVITSADFAVDNDINVLNMLSSRAGVSPEVRAASRPVQLREFKVRP